MSLFAIPRKVGIRLEKIRDFLQGNHLERRKMCIVRQFLQFAKINGLDIWELGGWMFKIDIHQGNDCGDMVLSLIVYGGSVGYPESFHYLSQNQVRCMKTYPGHPNPSNRSKDTNFNNKGSRFMVSKTLLNIWIFLNQFLSVTINPVASKSLVNLRYSA